MHRSRLSNFILDCKVDDIDAAATFWSRALGRAVVPPTPESGNYRELTSSKEEPMLLLQQVTHDSRIHLDIETDNLDAEVKRLEALGAKRIAFVKERWWVLEAPSGHRFCVVQPQRGALDSHATAWDDAATKR
ncbi:VOC family protein [Hyalangium versicolor]|uniref:VOC family protein n=1 Tax=Hyalangium versicolor TaxID=2861190 RepID=UPI001CCEB5F0|nr:VOC family protein [Hyalangium versicolor]